MEERRIAQLEAENALLHQRMSAKDSHIAMLEDRLLKMSVELASSRAREDEQHLFYRQQQQQKATAAVAEADDHKHALFSTPPVRRNSRRGGAAGIISNIIRLDRSERSLDKSDLSHDLSVDFPSSLPAADDGGLQQRSSLWSVLLTR